MVSVYSHVLSRLGIMLILWSFINTCNEDHKIHTSKLEKIKILQALPYTEDSITLMPHAGFDYSLERKHEYLLYTCV